MVFIEVGSKLDIKERNRNSLNAYMFWTDTDCYSIKPDEAFAKFSIDLWLVEYPSWISSMILTQDPEGLTVMRDEYTKKTGRDWKSAKLNDVREVLGYCNDLYDKGLVLRNGIPNIKALGI